MRGMNRGRMNASTHGHHAPRALTVALTLSLAAAPALAVDEGPAIVEEIEALDQATLDQAEGLFFQALAHYRQDRFEAAAVDFQQAYVLTGHRDLLFNVARSRERVGDTDGAVEWYRAYLATQPADETAVLHRIRQLGGDPGAPAVGPGPTPGPGPSGEPTAGGSASPWPWVALGVGVAAAGAGVYFGLDALDTASQARAAETAATAGPLADDAEQSALIAHVGFGVAAAAVGTAVVLWWLEDDAAHTEGRVDLGVVPGGGFIGYGSSF